MTIMVMLLAAHLFSLVAITGTKRYRCNADVILDGERRWLVDLELPSPQLVILMAMVKTM